MYRTSRVNLKVEPRSSLTFTCDLLYIASILFTHVKFAFRKNHAPVDSQTKSCYTFLFSALSSQLKKKTLNQKQDNKGKSIGRTGSVVRIVRKGKKVARALWAFSSIAWLVSRLLRWRWSLIDFFSCCIHFRSYKEGRFVYIWLVFCCNRCQCHHWVKSIERFIWIFREWAPSLSVNFTETLMA